MHRAIHRLQPKLSLFELCWREHGIAIVLFVPADYPQIAFGDVWCVHHAIIAPHEFFAQVIFHLLTNNAALRMPKDQSLAVVFLNRKQIEFAPEFAMIALLSFFALSDPRI